MADDKAVTPAQLALAWVLAQGDDIVPIPGTKRRRYLQDNIAAVSMISAPASWRSWIRYSHRRPSPGSATPQPACATSTG